MSAAAMDLPSPSRLTQPLVPAPQKFRAPRRPLLQIAFKVLFVVFAAVALCGRVVQEHTVWKLAFPAPTICCFLLVVCYWATPGVACRKYAAAVLMGLFWTLLGDVLIVEDPEMQLFYLAFLCSMVGVFCFAYAFWTPSLPTSKLADAFVDTTRAATPASSAGVPLHIMRLIPIVAMFGGLVAAWRTIGWHDSPLIVPVAVYIGSLGLMTWRAAARVGYRVPLPSPKVHVMLKRSVMRRLQEWEHVEVQWSGVAGAFALSLSQALIGYNRLWEDDSRVIAEYGAAVLHWFAVACLAGSVGTIDPPTPSLKDPSLLPEPYDGQAINVLMILPDRDFDVTEVAVPWFFLTRRKHRVWFATEHGAVPHADPLLLTGVMCGQLGAEPLAKQMYFEMQNDPNFLKPLKWADIEPETFGGLLLPGGHAPGMRQYLGSPVVQRKVAEFWQLARPVGAICHGVLVLARSKNPDTNLSLLHDRNVTCLPAYMEQSAFAATCCCLGRYYRTYQRTVQGEVTAALGRKGIFYRGPVTFTRGTPWDDNENAYVIEHRNLITARWPGDAFVFARRFIALLEEVPRLY